MKICDRKNMVTRLACAALTLALTIFPTTYAQDAGNKHPGFEKGKHEGHFNDNG